MRFRTFLLTMTVIAFALAGCEDPLQNILGPVPDEPSVSTLYEFDASSVRQPSAFDAIGGAEVRTDQSAAWDLLLGSGGAGMEFRPRSVVLDVNSTAGLQRVETGFEALETAPSDGYVTDEPVPVEEGAVYAIRSRQDPQFGGSCVRYRKLEVLSVDGAAGTVTFRHLGNPNCSRRTLVPGETGAGENP